MNGVDGRAIRHGVLVSGERRTPVMMRTTVVPGSGGLVSAAASARLPNILRSTPRAARTRSKAISRRSNGFSLRRSLLLQRGNPRLHFDRLHRPPLRFKDASHRGAFLGR